MKLSIKHLALLALVLCTRTAFGQTGFSESVKSYTADKTPASGNDFWFAPTQNYTDDSGKYVRIYISSLTPTIAYVEFNGHITSLTVPAYTGGDSSGVVAFDVPLEWELKSSGIAENKGIHVWSPLANLSVYVMSHHAYSGDGFYCIPTQDLGTDYVVAGFESLFEGFGSYVYDFPSEFTITATQNNTSIDITPWTDLRRADTFPYNNNVVAYPKGVKFSVALNRGQAVQFQAVKAQDADNYDVTGTIIHANIPVGIVGGSMCPNIPADFPYCDYITNMIPPVQSWGRTYYTTYPTQPQGMAGHDFALYCLISTVPNQEIVRTGCGDSHLEAVLGPKYDHYYVEEECANKWTSNYPFLLVEYFNTSTYPDNINGNGDPTEFAINPAENFSKDVLFQAAYSVGVQSPYDNYANVTVNIFDVKNVRFDTARITAFPSQPIDNLYEIFTVPHIKPGAHEVTSDSGVGVSIYGFGYDESYAWAGSLGAKFTGDTTNSSGRDTNAPVITFVTDSTCLRILLVDTTSGLLQITPNSMSNVSFSVDTAFAAGAKNSFADLCVIDPMQSGYLQLIVIDKTGNTSIVNVTYTHPPIVSPPGFTVTSVSFDSVPLGTRKTLPLQITDTSSQYPITINRIWTDASEFVFDGGLTANQLPITLSPLQSHNFTITFRPARDSVYICAAFAQSYELPAVRIDSLRGIGYTVTPPAGVAQESQTKVHATITPNPAANSVSLNYALPHTANVSFELSSIDGRKVFFWNADAVSQGEHTQSLDISSLVSGSYIYSFNANGQSLNGKLIINK